MNGYISITINGASVGIKFGYLAVKEFTLAAEKKRELYYDKTVDEKGKESQQLSFFGISKLIHCGYKNNCEVKEVEPTLTLEDFNNWVEGSISDAEIGKQVTEALTVFAQSQYVKTLSELGKESSSAEDSKKKIGKQNLKKSKAAS